MVSESRLQRRRVHSFREEIRGFSRKEEALSSERS